MKLSGFTVRSLKKKFTFCGLIGDEKIFSVYYLQLIINALLNMN